LKRIFSSHHRSHWAANWQKYEENLVAFRVIADHIRALTFAITDGAVPSNEGRGYVIRRIARRSVRYGLQLGKEEPFLYNIVPVVVEHYKNWYPELIGGQDLSMKLIKQEEEAFLRTLSSSQRYLDELVQQMKKQGIKKCLLKKCSDFTIPTVCLWTSSTMYCRKITLAQTKRS